MIVDESFFENKFGEVKYLAKAEKFHPTGVIITDYVADAIMLSGQVLYARSYESLLGEYHWNVNPQSNVVARGYINGIIYTGYKEKYADLFEMIKNGELATLSDMLKNDKFSQFVSDIYDRLGFCYSLNPNFKDDALSNPAWDMVWHYTISFDEKISLDSTETQVKIVTKKVFVRNSDLNLLKDLLENEGCNVEDLYVSTMPAMDNKLCIVVEFYIGWQNF
jgi:hypothetical protein